MDQGAENQRKPAVQLPPIYTIADAMVMCGVDNTDIFDGETAAKRFASDIFSNSYKICMDKPWKRYKMT